MIMGEICFIQRTSFLIFFRYHSPCTKYGTVRDKLWSLGKIVDRRITENADFCQCQLKRSIHGYYYLRLSVVTLLRTKE